jgi:hypothetical protein
MREANEELQQVEKDVNQTIKEPVRGYAPMPYHQSPVTINTPEDKTTEPESEPKQDA